jgi:hypothetical protein
MKNKKPLYIALLSLDAVLTIGLAIFNLVMMINTIGKSAAELLGGEEEKQKNERRVKKIKKGRKKKNENHIDKKLYRK